ncbi:serine/threonine-protein kinase dyf-5-like [Mytilus californianus]|uniref:serine/threonine-protein kinase dyf-5-like n=1 Tax=Mytilus californianus TaxID=6549 RepID=UPI0022451711|nr:serine/threonine-protein kinase dyf-5-like [Mytilus californianus]
MNRYQIFKQLGDGTYGSVLLAKSIENQESVAIKKMKKKYYSWDECLNLREVKSLRKLNHPNIVRLKEVIRENDQLFFVFEFMKENLYQLMKDRDKLFPESVVRNIIYQVLQGLAFMHKHGFFHRDLKPENLLCTGADCCKIADFGLAREIRSRPPYTDYVSTRWYRAPEILLRSVNYNSPIDLFAVGAIMAELYTLRPLFPGTSEIDQIFKICSILGTPQKDEWEEGYKLAAAMNFRWPQCVTTNLKTIIPHASPESLHLMKDMLLWNPSKRPTASQSLKYQYFNVGQNLGLQQTVRPSPTIQNNPSPVISPQKPKQEEKMYNYNPSFNQNSPYHQPSPTHQATPQFQASPQPFTEKKSNPMVAPSYGKQIDNDAFAVSVKKKPQQSGRKRWGAGLSETWDDWDDFDFGAPKKPAHKHVAAKPLPSIGPKRDVFGKENDDEDDFLTSILNKKNVNKAQPRVPSGRSSASSAKNHYLSKSRYLPGINPKSSAKKETPSYGALLGAKASPGGISNVSRPSIGPIGSTRNNADAGYVPSFMSTTKNTNYPPVSWKRAQPGPLSMNKNSAGLGGKPVGGGTHGRTDWAAKYLKS